MQVHRFHNAAGLSLAGRGETRYLSADEAEKLGNQLLHIATSIRNEEFADSPALTLRFESFAQISDVPEPQEPDYETPAPGTRYVDYPGQGEG